MTAIRRIFATAGRQPCPGKVKPMDPREQAALDELRRRGAFDRYFASPAASGASSAPATSATASEAGRRTGRAS